MFQLHNKDCLAQLEKMESNSVHALVTDPPAGIGFMGASWDHNKGGRKQWLAWMSQIMRECLRVMKPGAHGFVWALPRTSHWTATACEDAGFEVRDVITHLFGSGFPKSLDVSKQLDKEEKHRWLEIAKAVDNLCIPDIITGWKRSSNPAMFAGIRLEKSGTETGTNTQRNDFVRVNVVRQTNLINKKLIACIADLTSCDHPLIRVEQSTALGNAEATTIQLSGTARFAESTFVDLSLLPLSIFTVQCDAKGLLSEKAELIIKAIEALKIWLGSNKSSKQQDTNVLCAELIDALKLIILSQSKTFLSLDTNSQMDFASAISVTITESTAESLISFTASTLKSKALDKAAGAEREIISSRKLTGKARVLKGANFDGGYEGKELNTEYNETAPTTDAAKQWAGWGTALKPASEHWILVRKPIDKESGIAKNVLKHGCGGLNIDASRVGMSEKDRQELTSKASKEFTGVKPFGDGGNSKGSALMPHKQGRFPANLVLSHNEDCFRFDLPRTAPEHEKIPSCTPGCSVAMLDAQSGMSKSTGGITDGKLGKNGVYGHSKGALTANAGGLGDTGGASRFFYCAKASKREKNAGYEGLPEKNLAGGNKWTDCDYRRGDGEVTNSPQSNHHPTVKSTRLMCYLIRMITPPNGVILDPFCGSGSTGVAAIECGYHFVGIEKDQEYIEIAKKRLTHAKDLYGAPET